jgi:hypothetical protein
MSSTEDDTFNKLKSITMEEALDIYHKVYIDATKSMQADGIDTSSGIPISLIRHEIDAKLKPYGINFDTIFPFTAGDFS